MIPVWIIASFQKIDAHSGTKFQSSLYLSYTGSQRPNIWKKCGMNEELLDKIEHLRKNIKYFISLLLKNYKTIFDTIAAEWFEKHMLFRYDW